MADCLGWHYLGPDGPTYCKICSACLFCNGSVPWSFNSSLEKEGEELVGAVCCSAVSSVNGVPSVFGLLFVCCCCFVVLFFVSVCYWVVFQRRELKALGFYWKQNMIINLLNDLLPIGPGHREIILMERTAPPWNATLFQNINLKVLLATAYLPFIRDRMVNLLRLTG